MFATPFHFLFAVDPFQLVELMYFFIAAIAMIIAFITLYLFHRSRRSARRKLLRKVYSDQISKLAICEDHNEAAQTIKDIMACLEADKLLKDKFTRSVLIKELVTAAKNMTGTAKENIGRLYVEAGLVDMTIAQLKKEAWHIKARAIQTLAHLDQKQHIARIYRHTNNRNELLRSEARVAVVRLTGFDGLRFLDVISYPLTEWEQLCLVYELSENHQPKFENIPLWLHSDNDSVVEFALRLVESYRILDMHGDVAFCLAHRLPSIRKKAVQTICAINQPLTSALLVSQLLRDEEDVQLVVLDALGKVGSEADLAVLWPFLSHPRTIFKITAARAIRNSHAYGMTMLQQQVDNAVYPWNTLVPQLEKEVYP